MNHVAIVFMIIAVILFLGLLMTLERFIGFIHSVDSYIENRIREVVDNPDRFDEIAKFRIEINNLKDNANKP